MSDESNIRGLLGFSDEENAEFDAKLKAEGRKEFEFVKSVMLSAIRTRKKDASHDNLAPTGGSRINDLKLPDDLQLRIEYFTKTADLDETLLEIMDQTDRGAAILAGSLVDEALKDFLKTSLKPQSDSEHADVYRSVWEWTGPLGTFSSRISMAFVTKNVGPKTLGDLVVIKDIRNKFAHSLLEDGARVDFSTPEISELCNELSGIAGSQILFGGAKDFNTGYLVADCPRSSYIVAAVCLAKAFLYLAHPRPGLRSSGMADEYQRKLRS